MILQTYHGLFKLNKEESNLLSSFALHYNHVYHHAYALWAKQQAIIFPKQRKLSTSALLKSYTGNFPKLDFKLSAEHKKSIIANKQISSRQLNSILFELQGNLKSFYEVTMLDLKHKQDKLLHLNKEIDLFKQKIKADFILLAYQPIHKKALHAAFHHYKTFKSNPTNQYKKFAFPTSLSQALIKTKYKLYLLTNKRNSLQHNINKIICNLLQGKLPLCFGSKALFHKQFNLKHYHKNYNPKQSSTYFKQWQSQWKEVRNNSLFLMGAKAESYGNQSCQAIEQENGLFTLKIRLPDYILLSNNPTHDTNKRTDDNYLFLHDINFGYAHDKLKQALLNGEQIHYRISKNINRLSPKYGSWTIAFTIEEESKPIITNKNCGAIGIDLNQGHISVAEIDNRGNLYKSYNIPLKLSYFSETYHANPDRRNHDTITTLSSNQSAWLIEQVVVKLCVTAKKQARPIVVEELDFEYKKKTLSMNSNKGLFMKKRRKQLCAFVYSKFKQALLARAKKEGVEVIEVNPAYTSLLGLVKYQKQKGLSIHQAASYVIGRKGLGYKEKIKSKVVLFNHKGKIIDAVVPARKPTATGKNDLSFLKALAINVKQAQGLISCKPKAQKGSLTPLLSAKDQILMPQTQIVLSFQ